MAGSRRESDRVNAERRLLFEPGAGWAFSDAIFWGAPACRIRPIPIPASARSRCTPRPSGLAVDRSRRLSRANSQLGQRIPSGHH
jgi:hypothetical protein